MVYFGAGVEDGKMNAKVTCERRKKLKYGLYQYWPQAQQDLAPLFQKKIF